MTLIAYISKLLWVLLSVKKYMKLNIKLYKLKSVCKNQNWFPMPLTTTKLVNLIYKITQALHFKFKQTFIKY